MKFKFEMESQGTKVTYETDAIISTELCREFQRFLSGCGYVFKTSEEILIWNNEYSDHIVEEL